MPGMTATAEIKVGKRRVIQYFLYPLIRYMDEWGREP
jgi:HlyD family secretion protein